MVYKKDDNLSPKHLKEEENFEDKNEYDNSKYNKMINASSIMISQCSSVAPNVD